MPTPFNRGDYVGTFENWMRQQGLSESSVKKYGGAVSGPLTAWANKNSILAGPLSNIKDWSTFHAISTQIQKLPIFLDRNSTGHQMYSNALVKFAEYLQQPHETPTSSTTTRLDERIPVSEAERISLANKIVEALPGSRRRQQHDLDEGGFRIMADGNQCAAVYFAKNAPIHLVEFALDVKRITVGEVEQRAIIAWLEYQKTAFGGHDARNHKIGKQVDWFRIGFMTYGDAILFVNRLVHERRNQVPTTRWAIPGSSSTALVSGPARSNLTVSDNLASISTDTWTSTSLRMVKTALQTTASSNGQVVSQTIKNKNNRFNSESEFVCYVNSLIEKQNGLCAISGLPLLSDSAQEDNELKASLDRIDSNAHYVAGNLQVVCRFINRWKGADQNSQFKVLLERLRQHWILTNAKMI